ncbi:MAG: GTP-binding protein [Lachnospiraceae bacterium]|nr:GTP-binding protein [Candidatus Colinaster equi]
MTKIDVVSGFLGAGKTTLIKKLLQEALKGEQVVLIENEFGEIGVDGGFLKDAGIQITEMNSGCICCSLVGDFGAALKEVVEKYNPSRVIIEPSGVGKLSDVMKAVVDAGLGDDVVLNSAVAVVDASKAKMYIKNFGEFFINQIEHAGTIILSRTGNISEDKMNKAIELIREHNDKAVIITTPWDELDGKAIMNTIEGTSDLEAELLAEVLEHAHEEHHHHEHDENCTCGCHDHDHEEHEHHHHDDEEHEHHHHDHEEHEHHHDHEEHEHHHEHDENCTCGCHDHDHHHHADEVFVSWGIETTKKFTKDEIENILNNLEDDDTYGLVLRSKGMVQDASGNEWIYFDYTPGEQNVRNGKPDVTGKICVIGSKLNEANLAKLFE